MKNYVGEIYRGLRSLLQLKAILIGVAILNFTVVYLLAREANGAPGTKFCFGAPWYLTAPWENFPFLLLLAAVLLYLGRWWGYLMAVNLCAPVVYQGVIEISQALMEGLGLDWMWYGMSLQSQYVLAAGLMSMAVASLAREVKR